MTIQDEPESLIMKFEGRMVGPWVTECRRTWTTLFSSLSARKLTLDLSGVTFADESGLELLGEISRTTRVAIIANSPLTKHFADQAIDRRSIGKKGG